MIHILLNILFLLIVLFLCFVRIKNVCEKNDDLETIGDVLQILIISYFIYRYTELILFFKFLFVFIVSIFVKNLINYSIKKIYRKKEEIKKCKDCNPYDKWEK